MSDWRTSIVAARFVFLAGTLGAGACAGGGEAPDLAPANSGDGGPDQDQDQDRDQSQDRRDAGAGDATTGETARPDAPPTVARFPVVFADDFADGVSFASFGGAINSVGVDTSEARSGTASLRVQVPAAGYTGGALRSAAPIDLSPYNALTFWAKASDARTLNVTGIGNDAMSATYAAEWNAVPLTTAWTKYVVPIPLPGKLTAETGLFHFAEGSDEGAYTIWFDDIQYETLDPSVLGLPQPAIATETASRQVGDSFPVDGASVTFAVNGASETLSVARPYFVFTSSDPTVATVDAAGSIVAVGPGAATISAALGGIAAGGAITLTSTPVLVPEVPAPAPTASSADVISLLSGVYTDRQVDTWSAVWDTADVEDVPIAGVPTKHYSNLTFAGIEFFGPPAGPVDATGMVAFHLDVWTPTASMVGVKLVDFGADGAFGGGDDSESQVAFDAASVPALATATWLALDIPLTTFTGLAARAHLAQLVLVTDPGSSLFVENVYFHP